jgi:hypothetical protein
VADDQHIDIRPPIYHDFIDLENMLAYIEKLL